MAVTQNYLQSLIWKQTAQYSLADALLVEHKSLSKPDDVHEIIDWKQIETTLSHLYASGCGAAALPAFDA